MIDEQKIEKLIERLVERVNEANLIFLGEIGNNLKELSKLNETEAHKLMQILKYGGNYEDIIYKINQITNLEIKDIDEIFHKFAKTDRSFYKQFYQYKDIPFVPYEKNKALVNQVQALANITKNELYNFMRTDMLGYTLKDLNGNVVFYGLRETYINVLDEAILNVGQGKISFDEAMSRTLRQLGEGLKTINYGKKSMRLDSAVRMHISGALSNLHNETQKIYGAEFDSDGVEISVHNNPAPDHEIVQGKQFSTVKPNETELSEYEKLQAGLEATTYQGKKVEIKHSKNGSYRPISQYNCYHYVYSIILGVSKPQYTNKKLKEIIDFNNKKVKIDNKEYTKYECTQLQRRYETAIREQSDIQYLAEKSKNDSLTLESQQKITELKNKYYEISRTAGLPPKLNRL